MNPEKKDRVLSRYCGNGMEGLRKLCNPLIARLGGITQADYDDFYSIALEVLSQSVERYDENTGCTFAAYYTGNVERRYINELRRRNTKGRRSEYGMVDSLDRCVGEDGLRLADTIASDFDVFDEVMEHEGCNSDSMMIYLSRLSIIQRTVLIMMAEGYSSDEIKEALAIDARQYRESIAAIRAYENIRVLM